jgi:hypothetical protein
MKKIIYLSAFIFISQFCVSNSWACGAGFKIFAANIDLPKENGVYAANITVGQSLEIIAKGWAYPKSPNPEVAKGAPMRADAGTWMFDDKIFNLLNTQSDETQYKLVLGATTPGQYKIRFVGVVFDNYEVCEIVVNVSNPKDK